MPKHRYQVRTAATDADVAAAQALRHLAFHDRPGRDVDAFDPVCRHVLIEDAATGTLVACFRVMPLASGGEIERSYAAQFYGLGALGDFPAPMAELGRFCIHPDWQDPDILRLAWADLTRRVDRDGVGLLFGCASFRGTEASAYLDAFALLRDRYLAPPKWLPRVKAPDVFRFARRLSRVPDRALALRTMPPLLRSYLTMGGWVSDHAVVDRQMDTLHVFTGLEVGAIPPARARALRALAG